MQFVLAWKKKSVVFQAFWNCIEGLWLPLEKTYFPLFLEKQNPETKASSCVKREDDKLVLFYATVIVARLWCSKCF